MSLQDSILAVLARNTTGSCTLKALRDQIREEPPQAIDAALVGLKRTGRIHILGGVISLPSSPAAPVEGELSAEQQEAREISIKKCRKYRADHRREYLERQRLRYAKQREDMRREISARDGSAE